MPTHKYRIWNRGGDITFSDVLPEGTPIVGVNGFRYITRGAHHLAAGYPDDICPLSEDQKKEPAHFNYTFAEINLDYA